VKRHPRHARRWRALALVVVAGGSLFSFLAPAALAQTLTVTPSQVAPGGQMTYTADGCPFNDPFGGPFFRSPVIAFSPDIAGVQYTLHADAISGVFSGTVSIPADAIPGNYVLLTGCDPSGGPRFEYPPAPFTITGTPPTTAPTTTTSPPTTISPPTTTSPTTSSPPATTTAPPPTTAPMTTTTAPPPSTAPPTTSVPATVTTPSPPMPSPAAAAFPVVVAPAPAATVGTPSLTVSPSEVAPGGQLMFRGDGCPFNAPGQGPFFRSPAIRTSPALSGLRFTLDADAQTGVFTGTVTIPAGAPPGAYQLLAGCDPSTGPPFEYPPAAFRVGPGGTGAGAGATSSPPLARTGDATAGLLAAAALALVLGEVLLMVDNAGARRRVPRR
jgi:hypothetical protein